MPSVLERTVASLPFKRRREELTDFDPLTGLRDEVSEDYPDAAFTIHPTGDIVLPAATLAVSPRLVTYLRQQVRLSVGFAHVHVLTNTDYESERHSARYQVQQSSLTPNMQNQQMLEILDTAIAKDASDTYINVGSAHATVSYRINGLKQPSEGRLSPDQGFDLCRALWSRANETFEERMACDCSFTYEGKAFRGNSLPTHESGVGVVLRMRDPSFYLPLEKCGYSERQIESIKGAMESPGGLILLTGETNSGKSSTMATLMGMMPDTIKAIEISDPVEVSFPHITQVNIPKFGDDAEKRFAKILAALVRQNPDTLILGEIRDEDTSDAAMEMALQGKRVISTLHTQSCILSFARLGDLGMDKSLIYKQGFIAAVVNQNLVPTLCSECKTTHHRDESTHNEIVKRHTALFGEKARYTSGISCGAEKCVGGVTNQTLVAEVFPMYRDRDGKVIGMLQQNKTTDALKTIAENWGMESKHQHAYAKVMDGQCDPHQVETIIGRFVYERDRSYPDRKDV